MLQVMAHEEHRSPLNTGGFWSTARRKAGGRRSKHSGYAPVKHLHGHLFLDVWQEAGKVSYL